MRLTRHEFTSSTGEFRSRPPDRLVTGYEFRGIPPAQRAFAKNAGACSNGRDRWQLLRVIGGFQGDWTGDFSSLDDLQVALENALDLEALPRKAEGARVRASEADSPA